MRIKNELKKIKLKITIASPVCISSGESYGILDYTLKGNKILVIDYDKFFEKLSLQEKEEFKKIIKTTDSRVIWKVRAFLNKVVTREIAKDEIDITDKAKERIEESLKEERKSLRKLKIEKIFKTANTPCIPGSSLKGAIRTAILDRLLEELLKSGQKKQWIDEVIKKINKAINLITNGEKEEKKAGFRELKLIERELEAQLLCFLNKERKKQLSKFLKKEPSPTAIDPFRLLKVTDFLPVCNLKRKVRALERGQIPPVLAEFVDEGSFEGYIIVDEGLLKSLFKELFRCNLEQFSTTEWIIESIRKHYGFVFKKEKELLNDKTPFRITGKAKEYVIRYNTEVGKKRLSLIKLGKFSGALSKTFKFEELRKIYDQKAKTYKPEPKTVWVTEETETPGWCFLEIEDAD
ncbi:CRISPR-associated RAMP protein, Csm5 family [Thermovibrio ammonificans HB-1]|uniref:CRISPR-associated RAMP protein, Csm5 family n=1 Tax=Thermovibrio ammonificans (strain DSM 15698 / JCM 12110 / HB-1) TaxID=648996 RepID=E8T6Q1_THEA1|nr:type III-A CRISPR-associated RAMP protein Csm5 [Thermovibrio ammonificans]ADU96835.1 CRISPR-associated RAMP protein, Csm5 family [Thermovibrio ammonificans HB-1]